MSHKPQPSSRSHHGAKWSVLVCALLGTVHCVPPLVPFGATVASFGSPNRGRLYRSTPIPERGEAFELFRNRHAGGFTFGTARLVGAISRAARFVARHASGGASLRVADLSVFGGGQVPRHHSHRVGRDVDLLYYALDASGRSVLAPGFVQYTATGEPLDPNQLVRFDLIRNWWLVEAMARDLDSGVIRIFCATWIKALLLEHARQIGRDPAIISRAEQLLRQPGDSAPHDDHFHVRIACSADERSAGCLDGGPIPWWLERDWMKGESQPADTETVMTDMAEEPEIPTTPTPVPVRHRRH